MNGRRSAAVAAVLVAGLAGCGGSSHLATVGKQTITREQVDRLVEHGKEEALSEQRTFPGKGSAGYGELEHEALAILVARAQIAWAAERLGIHVSQAEILERVSFPHKELIETLYEGARRQLGIPEESEKGASAQVLADAVRVELTLQKVERRVGAQRLQGWVERARKLPVAYAAG